MVMITAPKRLPSAVGSLAFVDGVKNQLGVKAAHRDVLETDGSYAAARAESSGIDLPLKVRSLRPQKALCGMKPLMKQRHSFIRPTRVTIFDKRLLGRLPVDAIVIRFGT